MESKTKTKGKSKKLIEQEIFAKRAVQILNGSAKCLVPYHFMDEVESLQRLLKSEIWIGPGDRPILLSMKDEGRDDGRLFRTEELIIQYYRGDPPQTCFVFEIYPLPLGQIALLQSEVSKTLPTRAGSKDSVCSPSGLIASLRELRWKDLHYRILQTSDETGASKVIRPRIHSTPMFTAGEAVSVTRHDVENETFDVKLADDIILTREYVAGACWRHAGAGKDERPTMRKLLSRVVKCASPPADSGVFLAHKDQATLVFGIDDGYQDGPKQILGIEISATLAEGIPLPTELFPPLLPEEVQVDVYPVQVWGSDSRDLDRLVHFRGGDGALTTKEKVDLLREHHGRIWSAKSIHGEDAILRIAGPNETLILESDADEADYWVKVENLEEWPSTCWNARNLVRVSVTPQVFGCFIEDPQAFPVTETRTLTSFGVWARLHDSVLDKDFAMTHEQRVFIGSDSIYHGSCGALLRFQKLNLENLSAELERVARSANPGSIAVVLELSSLTRFKQELLEACPKWCRQLHWDVVLLLDFAQVTQERSPSVNDPSYPILLKMASTFTEATPQTVTIVDVALTLPRAALSLSDQHKVSLRGNPFVHAGSLGNAQVAMFDRIPTGTEELDLIPMAKQFFRGEIRNEHWPLFRAEIPVFTVQMEDEIWTPLKSFFSGSGVSHSQQETFLMDIQSSFAHGGVSTALRLVAAKADSQLASVTVLWMTSYQTNLIDDLCSSLVNCNGHVLLFMEESSCMLDLKDIDKCFQSFTSKQTSGRKLGIVRGRSGIARRGRVLLNRLADAVVEITPRWQHGDLGKLIANLQRIFVAVENPSDRGKLKKALEWSLEMARKNQMYRHFFIFTFMATRWNFAPVDYVVREARNVSNELASNSLVADILKPDALLDTLAFVTASSSIDHDGFPYDDEMFRPLMDRRETRDVLYVFSKGDCNLVRYVHPFFARLHLVQQCADSELPFPPAEWILERLRKTFAETLRYTCRLRQDVLARVWHSIFIRKNGVTPLAAHFIQKGAPDRFADMCKLAGKALPETDSLVVQSKVYRKARHREAKVQGDWAWRSVALAEAAWKLNKKSFLLKSNLAHSLSHAAKMIPSKRTEYAERALRLLEECYNEGEEDEEGSRVRLIRDACWLINTLKLAYMDSAQVWLERQGQKFEAVEDNDEDCIDVELDEYLLAWE